jgi:hypothetical protein
MGRQYLILINAFGLPAKRGFELAGRAKTIELGT